jgi:hypothetical protein
VPVEYAAPARLAVPVTLTQAVPVEYAAPARLAGLVRLAVPLEPL